MCIWHISSNNYRFWIGGSYVSYHFLAVVFSADVFNFWSSSRPVEKSLFIFGLLFYSIYTKSIFFMHLVVLETVYCLMEYFLITEDTLWRSLKINDVFHKSIFVESFSGSYRCLSSCCCSCLLLTCSTKMSTFIAWSVTHNTLSPLHCCLMWGCAKHNFIYIFIYKLE